MEGSDDHFISLEALFYYPAHLFVHLENLLNILFELLGLLISQIDTVFQCLQEADHIPLEVPSQAQNGLTLQSTWGLCEVLV